MFFALGEERRRNLCTTSTVVLSIVDLIIMVKARGSNITRMMSKVRAAYTTGKLTNKCFCCCLCLLGMVVRGRKHLMATGLGQLGVMAST